MAVNGGTTSGRPPLLQRATSRRVRASSRRAAPKRSARRAAPAAASPKSARPACSEAPRGSWQEIARDKAGDGKRQGLPDADALFVLRDEKDGLAWFRVGLTAPPPEPWLGVNLVLDTDGNPDNGTAWWGVNTGVKFDRLVTLWLFRTGDEYQGVAGVADAADVASGEMMAKESAGLRLALDRVRPAVLVGVPRAALGVAPGAKLRVVAAVGSAMVHNDDLPDAGAAETTP